MSNQGQKALAGQAATLRNKVEDLNEMNFTLNCEVHRLQIDQVSILGASFFVGFWRWLTKWKNYQKP